MHCNLWGMHIPTAAPQVSDSRHISGYWEPVINWICVQGGKIDDITVLVAVVTEEDVPVEPVEPQTAPMEETDATQTGATNGSAQEQDVTVSS